MRISETLGTYILLVIIIIHVDATLTSWLRN